MFLLHFTQLHVKYLFFVINQEKAENYYYSKQSVKKITKEKKMATLLPGVYC